ncbi:MAG: ABC transporter ATP-binding protein [Ruminococcaceae bacterium]|nr:ABC transporter ATP-binding protein [Oscillospiraceae bacterium]MBQ9749681.1 ABC transporter ATP-binding protein [Clostridia bacterium]
MIKAISLEKSYGNNRIIKNVGLNVDRGEFVSIMGKSGSGKSTLLALLSGSLAPDSGEVYLDGESIIGISDKKLAKLRRTKLGFVYQSLNLIPTLNARDNILLPLYLNRESREESEERLIQTVKFLEIESLLKKFPAELSGGQRQRVAIARGLIHSPQIIMLDEPTGSLDSKTTTSVMELLCKINSEKGVTILQVTHSEDAAAYSDRIIRMSDGEVLS